jgi:hypothetical protein
MYVLFFAFVVVVLISIFLAVIADQDGNNIIEKEQSRYLRNY